MSNTAIPENSFLREIYDCKISGQFYNFPGLSHYTDQIPND